MAQPTGQEIRHHVRPLTVSAPSRHLFIPTILAAPVAAILAAAGFTETIYPQEPSRHTR